MHYLRAQTTGNYETKTLLGKEYLVVPVVAMIEGVRFGANQKSGELGLANEFGKFTAGWNTSPVVLGHPKVDDEFVSAGDPEVLMDYHLGSVFNTQLDDDKLKMEAWLDLEAKDKGDEFEDVFTRIENNETIEVSVGFFTEVESTKGTFKGQKYTGIWRNIVPDHLAFLKSGEIGACSVEDGCGTPRTNQKKGNIMPLANAKRAVSDLMTKKKKKGSYNEGAECPCGGTPTDCTCAHEVVLTTQAVADDAPERAERSALRAHIIESLRTQEIPSDLLSSDIIRALRDMLAETHEWSYVLGFTTEYVVYEVWKSTGYQSYRQDFSINSDGEVTFTSEPREVRLISKIVTVGDSSGDVNVNSNPNKETTMPKEETAPKAQQTEETTSAPTEAPKTEPAAEQPHEPTAQAKKVLTAQEYINEAPAEIREVLQSSLALQTKRKNDLIANLKSTGRCQFADEYLVAQSLETLENLAKLSNVPSYEGAAVPTRTQVSESGAVDAPKVFEAKTVE